MAPRRFQTGRALLAAAELIGGAVEPRYSSGLYRVCQLIGMRARRSRAIL